MPTEQKDIVTFDDWTTGPWHSLGSDHGPKKGYFYDCVNMQLYENGSLGPRPCLKEIGINGDSLFHSSYQHFAGVVWYQVTDFNAGPLSIEASAKARLMVMEKGSGSRYYWDEIAHAPGTLGSIDHSTFRTFLKPARYSEAAWDASSEILISSMPFQYKGDTEIIVGGDGFFKGLGDTSTDGYQAINANTDGTLDPASFEYPQNWDPSGLFGWRDRYWSWGDYNSGSFLSPDANYKGNRIYYSRVGEIGDWRDDDGEQNAFIAVGGDDNLAIVGCWQTFDSLLIAMADGRWYRYTYTDSPGFGEIRYIGTKILPDFYVTAAVTGSAIVYITRQTGVVVATKDNIDDQTFSYVKIPSEGDDAIDAYFMRGVPSHAHNAVCLPYKVKTVGSTVPNNVYKGDRSLDLVNGVWTHQLYFGPGDDSVLNPAVIDVIPMGNDHWGFFALDEYNTHNNPDNSLYVRPVTLNRPSNSNDTFTSNTEVAVHTTDTDDRFEGAIWLATYRPPEKTSAAIEKVIIDFDFWNSSGFTTPAFTVKADCVHQGDEISTVTVGSLDASELSSTSGTVYKPKRGRVVLRPGRMPLCSQIDVSITGIKSVAFNEVTVEYAYEPQTPLTNINT